MEFKSENKLELKDKIINIYNFNKKKIYITFLILILITISTIFIKFKNERENTLIAEKYIKAGIYLSKDQKNNAKILLEEIVLSNNRFYSILALNTIIEKELILEKIKILELFEILKKSNLEKNQQDLISLKQALYLIKESDKKNGNNLLKSLVDNKSILEPIAQELIIK